MIFGLIFEIGVNKRFTVTDTAEYTVGQTKTVSHRRSGEDCSVQSKATDRLGGRRERQCWNREG